MKGAIDAPSAAMWWITNTTTCSCGEIRSTVVRRGSSVSRSKPSHAASAAAASAASAATSTTRNWRAASCAGTIRCSGVPSAFSAIRVRRLSCRVTTSVTAAARAAVSSGPSRRSTNGML